MTVYLDIVLLENVLMNYIIIFATGIVLKGDCMKWRILFGSIIGAVYTVVMYLDIIPIYSSFIMKIVLSIVIVYVSFKPRSAKKLIKDLVIFYLVSFVFGGCVFALMYFLKPQMAQIRNGVYVGAYPIKVALVGGLVAFIVVQVSFQLVKTKLSKKDMIYEVQIFINEKSVVVKALLDTGNLLRDPITGFPVIVVEHKSLNCVLPEKVLNNIGKILGGDIEELGKDEEFSKTISRFRMIPFSSLGKQNGLLLGIKADCINVISDEKIDKVNNAIIGIYDKSFTKNGAYTAIFGLDMLEQGGNQNECIANFKI
ncbi:MAG: sigma-E processing peptidase SpoIIGA [Clostridia bacterium]|nr:sigma-E processing peptidase SpoIIGA [Clostridia bacterium]MBR4260932.1 sigma-E processing peptidase SpoIIGA [Clostridia bacterium]